VSSLLTLTPAEFCDVTAACREGCDWAITQPTMADVWDYCPRSQWLLWILDKLSQRPDNRTLWLLAAWCVRNTPLGDARVMGDLITDPRLLAALELTERYAEGKATEEQLCAAYATCAPAFVSAACAVAVALGYAEEAATPSARANARRVQADQLRRMISNPFRREGGAS